MVPVAGSTAMSSGFPPGTCSARTFEQPVERVALQVRASIDMVPVVPEPAFATYTVWVR